MIRYIGIDERLRVNMIIIDSYREILVADIISMDTGCILEFVTYFSRSGVDQF